MPQKMSNSNKAAERTQPCLDALAFEPHTLSKMIDTRDGIKTTSRIRADPSSAQQLLSVGSKDIMRFPRIESTNTMSSETIDQFQPIKRLTGVAATVW